MIWLQNSRRRIRWRCKRSEYGLEVIKKISKELTQRYGKGYDRSNLYHCLKFYKTFPEIVGTRRVDNPAFCFRGRIIEHYYRSKTLKLVTGMRKKPQNRLGVSVLCKGIFLLSIITVCLKLRKKELVESEMKELTAPYQNDKLEFIKNPVVAEFLGFSQNTDFTESDLEKSILSNLQKFLMELGKGYAFVARQQRFIRRSRITISTLYSTITY